VHLSWRDREDSPFFCQISLIPELLGTTSCQIPSPKAKFYLVQGLENLQPYISQSRLALKLKLSSQDAGEKCGLLHIDDQSSVDATCKGLEGEQ